MPDPGIVSQVKVVTEGGNAADQMQTKALLESCWTGSEYQCPRCRWHTSSQVDMIDHLAHEINQAIATVITMAVRPPVPKVG